MKNYLVLIAFVVVMLSTQVHAFNWTESVPIHSTDRQEARINGLWLFIEPTHSSTHGFIHTHLTQDISGHFMKDTVTDTFIIQSTDILY